jgi:hypothetical protein
MTKWDSTKDESKLPDWKDAGRRVLMIDKDGIEITGGLEIYDQFFDGQNEIPMFRLVCDDGSIPDFLGADYWRFIT